MPSMTIEMIQSIIIKLFNLEDQEFVMVLQYNEYKALLNYPDQTLEDIGCLDNSIILVANSEDEIIDEKLNARKFKLRSVTARVRGFE